MRVVLISFSLFLNSLLPIIREANTSETEVNARQRRREDLHYRWSGSSLGQPSAPTQYPQQSDQHPAQRLCYAMPEGMWKHVCHVCGNARDDLENAFGRPAEYWWANACSQDRGHLWRCFPSRESIAINTQPKKEACCYLLLWSEWKCSESENKNRH